MSDPEYEEITVGKRLVRARSGTGQSLSDWLTDQFHRFTWRTPLYKLRLRGRYPLKLVAVPADPLAGNAEAGLSMQRGFAELRGETVNLAAFDFLGSGISAMFAERLQRFDWLRDLAAAGPRAEMAPHAEQLTRKWLEAHGEKVSEPAWRPDIWGFRILNWAAHAPLILSSTDLVYRSAVLNGLARGARHLDRNADRAPAGLPRIAAWCGILAAGLLISGGGPRKGFGEAGLNKALATGMSEDGGIVCRTPQAQADLVLALAMVAKIYEARRMEAPAPLTSALSRAVAALQGLIAGDGGLTSWQGSAPLPADRVNAIIAASGVRGRALRRPREWGYQRVVCGQTVLVMDAAPPPVASASGCASTLAFELSDGPHRLIVNCGGGAASGVIAAELSEGLRTTAAHSTLTLADTNSTAIHADGSLGKGVGEVELDRQESDQESRIETNHDGYVRRFGLRHKRTLVLTGDGRELRGEDALISAKSRAKPATAPFAIRFHLAPGIEGTPTADGLGALLRIDRGPLWQFRCRGGALTIDDSIWIDGAGKLHATLQLVVTGEAPPGGASVGWVLKRAG